MTQSITLHSLPVFISAGICFYVGLYYLFMFIRRRNDRTNLEFSLACFSIAFYNISCAGLYNTATVAEGMRWQVGNFVGIGLITIFLTSFVIDFTKSSRTPLKYFIIPFVSVCLIFILFYRGELTFSLSRALPKTIDLGSYRITYNEVDPGLVPTLLLLVSLVIFIYALVLLFRFSRVNNKWAYRSLIISIFFFFCTSISDACVSMNLWSFIYLDEYAFLAIVLSMAYLMLDRFVDLYEEVEDLNIGLERRVQVRTRELESARETLEDTNRKLIETSDALWGEMQLAKKIQTVLLPTEPVLAGYEITAYMKTANDVGGDYYDVIHAGGTDWIVIGDVSGHGVAAGLIMMMAQTSLHSSLGLVPSLPPSSLISAANHVIYNNIRIMCEEKFMTMTVIACREDGKFSFSGAHQDIMVYRKASRSVEVIETEGAWLGIMPDISDRCPEKSFILDTGDVLLLYTDGVTEAFDAEGREFSQEKLKSIFTEAGGRSPDEIKQAILDALTGYECMDDLTMVVVRRM